MELPYATYYGEASKNTGVTIPGWLYDEVMSLYPEGAKFSRVVTGLLYELRDKVAAENEGALG